MRTSTLLFVTAMSLLITLATGVFATRLFSIIVDTKSRRVSVMVRDLDVWRGYVERDLGRTLTANEWPSALISPPANAPRWEGPYARERDSRDAWQHEYRLSPGRGVYSLGVDGIDARGAGDDIASWRPVDPAFYSSPYPNSGRQIILSIALLGAVSTFALTLVCLWRMTRWLLHRHR